MPTDTPARSAMPTPTPNALAAYSRISGVVLLGWACLAKRYRFRISRRCLDVALGGVAAHTALMETARTVYRQPWVEAVLLGGVVAQCLTGLALGLTRRVAVPAATASTATLDAALRANAQRVARLQVITGTLIALFLAVHVLAVLGARRPPAVDTDFYFAAAGLHTPGWSVVFALYYSAAVIALLTHWGCALQRRLGDARSLRAVWTMFALGAAVALAIVGCLAGWWIPVDANTALLGR